jgi:hypothetical protein
MADVSITAANVAGGGGQIYKTSVSVTAGQVVYVVASTGLLALASAASTLALSQCVGIALNGGAANQPIDVQASGVITVGGTLIRGNIYCVSINNAGGICPITDLTSAGANSGNFLSILGYAISTTQLEIGLNNTGVQW